MRPCSVRIAASHAAGGLRPALNVDRVGVLAAAAVIRLRVGRSGDNRAMNAAVTLPAHWRTGPAIFEGFHFGGIGAAAILLVERISDGAANDASDQRARYR